MDIVKIFTKNAKLRDKRKIFPQIRADLETIFGPVPMAAFGSRTTKRVTGKNDFDVMVRTPTEAELFSAPGANAAFVLFVRQNSRLYQEPGMSQHEGILNLYRNRVLPKFIDKWRGMEDEYGQPVEVDITFTDQEFPESTIPI